MFSLTNFIAFLSVTIGSYYREILINPSYRKACVLAILATKAAFLHIWFANQPP
jgi:hypothetical protein